MISYSRKGFPQQPGSNRKWMSGIFYPFPRRCPTILHMRFLPMWQVCDGLAFFQMASCPFCRIFFFMSVLSWFLQRLPWKFLIEILPFLFMMWTCGQGKLGQDLQTHTGHHRKQHSIRTATIQSWAHFNWWPSWVITAHISQPALLLLTALAGTVT